MINSKSRSNEPRAKGRKKLKFKHVVCKPCWELKYCPYGPLVEFFPLIHSENPIPLSQVKRSYKSWMTALKHGDVKKDNDVFEAIEKILCLRPKTWEWINQFDTTELSCSVFGHICPVFFMAEPLTETKEFRKSSRTIPRSIMLKVIRRDGQVCMSCRNNVPDNEIEFDHIIPFSRGGPTSAENLRVLCKSCNRKKSDALSDILDIDSLN